MTMPKQETKAALAVDIQQKQVRILLAIQTKLLLQLYKD